MSPYSPPSGSSGNPSVESLVREYVSDSAVAFLRFFDFFFLGASVSPIEYASSVLAHRSFLSFFFFFDFLRLGSGTASSKLAG